MKGEGTVNACGEEQCARAWRSPPADDRGSQGGRLLLFLAIEPTDHRPIPGTCMKLAEMARETHG